MPLRPRFPVQSRRGGSIGHWRLWGWFAVSLALVLMVIFGGAIFWKSGRWLVRSDSFEKISWALVLAGESRDCERTEAALELYREGRIDSVILSACRVFKTHYESEFILPYMVHEGYPKGKIFEFHQDAYSTLEEARLLIRQFRYQNLDTVLIITSNYHSARTRRIFRKLAQGYPQILVYAADFKSYDPDVWWSGRESRKYWFGEWIRTLYSWYELAGVPAENGTADFQNLIPDIWSGHGGEKGVLTDSIKRDSTTSEKPPSVPVDTLFTLPANQDSSQAIVTIPEPAKSRDSGETGTKPEKRINFEASTKVPEKRPFPKAEPTSKKKSPEKIKKK